MITSNLVFSQWDRIFKDAITTAAAIDRLMHHSSILEMNCGSFREEHAKINQVQTTITTTTKQPAAKKKAGKL